MKMPPDVPRCRGLKAGVPCPVPDNCDCMRIDREMDAAYRMASVDDRITLYVVCILVTALVISMITFWKATAADVGDPACLTKSQARAKYPKQWLYWHTAHHCWDATRGRANTAAKADGTVQIIRAPQPNRARKADREDMAARPGFDTNDNMVRPPPGSGSDRTIKVENPSIYFPDLMPGGGTVVAMLQPEAMTRSPLVADFDADPPQFEPWRQRISK